MSLATRCTSCGTVFRVVQDQLRVSEGWVRCGRCAEVFNAIESLVDLAGDPDAQDTAPNPQTARIPDTAFQATTAPETEAPIDTVADADLDADLGAALARAPEPVPDEAASAADSDRRDKTTTAEPDADAPAPPTLTATPAFLRQAEHAARWRRPRVRLTLALVALLAAAGLTAQAALAWHDLVAARWPATRAWVAQLCEWQGCAVEPPRRIESLAVESSGLVRAGPSGAYRLSVTLRNRESAMAVQVPALDLSLTDAQGGQVARRVLEPVALGVSTHSVAPGGELTLTATLRTGELPVAGYTIELFYP